MRNKLNMEKNMNGALILISEENPNISKILYSERVEISPKEDIDDCFWPIILLPTLPKP